MLANRAHAMASLMQVAEFKSSKDGFIIAPVASIRLDMSQARQDVLRTHGRRFMFRGKMIAISALLPLFPRCRRSLRSNSSSAGRFW
jgi:hypothetical protein